VPPAFESFECLVTTCGYLWCSILPAEASHMLTCCALRGSKIWWGTFRLYYIYDYICLCTYAYTHTHIYIYICICICISRRAWRNVTKAASSGLSVEIKPWTRFSWLARLYLSHFVSMSCTEVHWHWRSSANCRKIRKNRPPTEIRKAGNYITVYPRVSKQQIGGNRWK